MRYDAIIIGSGAGGGPIAHDLVRAGRTVLLLEKGPLLRTQQQDPRGLSDFKRDELLATGPEKRINIAGVANQGESFYNSHVEPDLNDEPHVYLDHQGQDRVTIEGYTAQVVGGGTQLFGAVSPRYTELDLRLQAFNVGRTDLADDPEGTVASEARDWPISYADLEPYYVKAERLLGVNGEVANQAKPFSEDHYQPPLPPNPISAYVADGMDRLGMARYRTPLAVITEDHAPSGRQAGDPKTGFVNRYGDPMGFKSSTWAALLAPVAHLPNVDLRSNCHVTHLESAGSAITRVHYRDPSGEPQSAEGQVVIVACSAIESVRLLKLSAEEDAMGFGDRVNANGLLGRYFLTHCFGGAEARVPDRFDKSLSLDSDWATDFCGREEFLQEHGLWAGGVIYNNTSDQALPISLGRSHGNQDLDTIWQAFVEDTGLTGEALRDFLDLDFGRRLSVSFMANQVPQPENHIQLHPTIRDKWNRKAAYVDKDWHTHDRHLMQVLAAQCRDILVKGVPGVNPDDVGFGGVYDPENPRLRIANHVLGGARFGTDASDSVLDPDCRHWQFDNLYVTDGSFMPTSGGANPTLTIEANAFRVADVLLTRI